MEPPSGKSVPLRTICAHAPKTLWAHLSPLIFRVCLHFSFFGKGKTGTRPNMRWSISPYGTTEPQPTPQSRVNMAAAAAAAPAGASSFL